MMTPDEAKREQNVEQALAQCRDLLPRLWRQVYQGCLAQGFGPKESFALVETYILASSNQNGIQPPREHPDHDSSDE